MISFNLPLQTVDVKFTLPPLEEGQAEAADLDVYLNVDSLIKEEASNMSAENIRSVKIQSMVLTVENFTTEDHFGALTSCSAGLASELKPDFINVAELTNNPETYATSLSLPVKADTELKDYFASKKFTYRVTATSRRATTTTLNCKATIKLKAEIGL